MRARSDRQSGWLQEIAPVLQHAAVTLVLVAILLAVGSALHLMERVLPEMRFAVRILTHLNFYLVLALFALFAFYTVALGALRLARALRSAFVGDAGSSRSQFRRNESVSVDIAHEPVSTQTVNARPYFYSTLIFDLALIFASSVGGILLSDAIHQPVISAGATVVVTLIFAYIAVLAVGGAIGRRRVRRGEHGAAG